MTAPAHVAKALNELWLALTTDYDLADVSVEERTRHLGNGDIHLCAQVYIAPDIKFSDEIVLDATHLQFATIDLAEHYRPVMMGRVVERVIAELRKGTEPIPPFIPYRRKDW